MAAIPLLVAIGLRLAGAGPAPSDEVGTLTRSASELLKSGHPRKALVLLRRARALDTAQTEVDRLLESCRARMGEWVPGGSDAEWIPTDDLVEAAVRANPDSMALVGRRLIEAEDLGGAVRVFRVLSESHAAAKSHLNAYREARTRQEMKVAFHLDLAKRAIVAGALTEAANQWRLAYSARPDDALLRELVEKSDESLRITLRLYERDLRGRLQARDIDGAIDVLRTARIAFPDMKRFQVSQDSLLGTRRTNLLARLEEISAMVDAGRESEAMEAMESLGEADPSEPLLAQAQELLQQRIGKHRRQRVVDSLARSFEIALQVRDPSRAEAVWDELGRTGMDAATEARLKPRIDSLRGAGRQDAQFHQAMASARKTLARGDLAEGRALVQKALSIKPDNAIAKSLLASLPAAPAAGEAVVRSGESTPDEERIRKLLLSGVTAYRAGEYEKAMSQWRQVLEIDSTCVQAQKYLANVGRKQARLR